MKYELPKGMRLWVCLLVLVAGSAHAGQADTSGITRALIERQRAWERMLDRQQRERFHEDYEVDRRLYGVNPPGLDATGVEVDGDDDD